MEGHDSMRVAMFGGGIGSLIGNAHRNAMAATGFELVAGSFSSDRARNLATAQAVGLDSARVYDGVESLVSGEDGRPDGANVAVIATPNYLHFPQADACLRAGWDVICEKPFTVSLDQARSLVATADERDLVLVVTHSYTGYPMVRRARELVAVGAVGKIRVIQVEYPQGWLAAPIEATGNRQAAWRTDPAQSGSGALGDIGTHAFNLAEFVTGLQVEAVASVLTSNVEGRRVDDNVNALVRYSGGVTGMIWASQVAIGHENDLRIRVIGDVATLDWTVRDPARIGLTRLGQPIEWIEDDVAAGDRDEGGEVVSIPDHQVQSFVTLYQDAARLIRARRSGAPVEPGLLQMGRDGARAVAFMEACIRSSEAGGVWLPVAV